TCGSSGRLWALTFSFQSVRPEQLPRVMVPSLPPPPPACAAGATISSDATTTAPVTIMFRILIVDPSFVGALSDISPRASLVLRRACPNRPQPLDKVG